VLTQCRLLGLIAALSLIACTGTETGNPSAQGSFALRARSGDTQGVTIGTAGGRVRVDSVWLSLGAISLSACDGPATEVAGAAVQDLVAAPEASRFDRELESYCGLATRYVLASGPLPNGAPADLASRSVLVIGQRNDGVAFRLASELAEPVALSVPAPGFPVDDASHSLILAFDLATWFTSVDLSTATVEPDGTIRVDAQHNATLRTSFDAGLGVSTSLHHDLNHDGHLDSDELTPIAH
jgi:hypothetical protein